MKLYKQIQIISNKQQQVLNNHSINLENNIYLIRKLKKFQLCDFFIPFLLCLVLYQISQEQKQNCVELIDFYFSDVNLYRDSFNKTLLESNKNIIDIDFLNKNYPRLKNMNLTNEEIAQQMQQSKIFDVIDNTQLKRKQEYKYIDFSDRTLVIENIAPKTRLIEINKLFEKIYKQPDLVFYEKNDQLKNINIQITYNDIKDVETLLQICQQASEEKQIEKPRQIKLKEFTVENINLYKQQLKLTKLNDYKNPQTQEVEKTFVQGLILKVTQIPNMASRGSIQVNFQKYGEIKFIEFTEGQDFCYIRFKENSIQSAKMVENESKEGKLTMDEQQVNAVMLTGDEEKQYWEKIFTQGNKRWDNRKKNNRRH